jgi:CHC2 zinc finger/Toprim domain
MSAAIARARDVPIEQEIARRGIKLRRSGGDLIGPCPVCGGTDRFAVHARKQVFNCRGCNARGDVIALVQHLDGLLFQDAVATLAGDCARPMKPAPQNRPATKRDNDDEQRAAKAERLWSQRRPIVEGTPPALYLRQRRCYAGLIPATLGYLPARDPHPPAMIAAFGLADEPEPGILAAPKNVAGVHLTRLTADGDKAPGLDGKPKIMLGTCRGSPIVIAPPNDLLGMAITEGIEDALTAHQATGLGAWAAGAAGFMPALADKVPNYIEALTIFSHGDTAGQRGALELAELLDRRGMEIRIEDLS